MSHSVLIVMDPIESIKTQKDTTFGLMLEAQRRGWTLHYCQPQDLYLEKDQVFAANQRVSVEDNPQNWFQYQDAEQVLTECGDFSAILMRKDPPFDMNYIYSTYLLELAQQQGALVVNDPASLRDCNEKLFTAWFPEHTPSTLVSANAARLKAFAAEHQDIILKPLDGMGGASIFRAKKGDPNLSVIIETLTSHGKNLAMAQQFIPEITDGDKRVLVVNGEVIPYTLARIPREGETRGNLAAGGSGVPMPITDNEKRIAEAIAPELMRRGLLFVGLDIIGSFVTEINVTSPTCMRELENEYQINIAGQLFSALEDQLKQ
ncbi:glutathione synthase [Kangiella sediminilitoris]|uniref:Glutathione synthetase n=1 Tax=Kangiella sediminilitoris TaxID=1144748 RepID=A0A1B3BDG4_9GAMM|nr:glutathione synthase [Kangiella sediminilitoris]AOE50874.1 Glutathione synthetase [Kangiella sediminilitoris]